MTAILGLIHRGHTYIGADSIAVGSQDGRMYPMKDPKVWRSGGMIVGAAGRAGYKSAFLACPPPRLDRGADALEQLRRWLPRFHKSAERYGLVGQGEDGTPQVDGGAIIGVRGRLFEVNGTYDVGEVDGPIVAIGCGGDLALGALVTLIDGPGPMPGPRGAITFALGMAERFHAFVRGPFVILGTEGER